MVLPDVLVEVHIHHMMLDEVEVHIHQEVLDEVVQVVVVSLLGLQCRTIHRKVHTHSVKGHQGLVGVVQQVGLLHGVEVLCHKVHGALSST